MNFIDGERLDRNRYTTEYQELYFEGKLSSSLTFLPSSQNSPQEKYYSQGYSNSNRNRKAMRSGNGEFFNGLGGESSTPINTAVKSLENAIPHRGKSSHREDNVICFQYLYDGQHTTDPAMSDQNNNRAATCSEGVSSEFYSNDDQTDLSKVGFVTQQSELDDFCQSVATTLGTGLQQDSRVLESYFAEMQSSNSRDVHSAQENGSINLSISSAKEFHGGKRQNDKNYICSSTEDKQNPFSKHVVYGGVGFEKAVHNPISTTQPLESREFDENGEVKGKKNGELTHSREGSGVGTAVEVEILQPQANFQQRSLIHKLGRSEDITNTSLDQVNSMLIAVGEGSNEHSRNIQISERILIPSREQSLYGRDHSPKSSLLAEDFMSPDHQTAISRGSSSGRSDICNEMQSLPDDEETNSDDIMAEHEQLQQPSSINDKKQSRNDKQLNEFMTEGNINRNHPDSSGDSPPNNEAQQSRDTCLSDTPMQQNGDAQQAQKQNADNPNLGKHIYPWMKESRQNTRRKQSTSSNSSSNGDKSSKRERTAYTNSQLVELEKEFHFNRYLCRPRRIEMAQMLNLTERQIKIWFQNRRMKYKKDQKLKAMPMSSMGREGSYYHQHHHPPNMNPEALFSRSNDHRHYSHSGHMHTSDTSGSMHGGMECSTGGRCYHGHRHGHGSHISQDSPNMIHQSLSRSSSTPFEGMNKAYPASNHKGNTNGRLTSPSSSSSNGTLSPGNGRSSGSFSSDVGMRSTPGSGTNQGLIQTGCGYLSHAVSPGNSMDDESQVMRGEKNNFGTDAHRPMNHSNYNLSLVGHGLSAFHRRVDDRMPFPPGGHTSAGQIPASSHYLGNYERQKSANAVAMLTEAPSSHSTVHSRYGQVHNPLESLTDCVHRSPREFLNQPLQFGHPVNGSRHPSADGFSSPFSNSNISFDRSRFERHVNHSPLDFSRSKSTSPRVPPNDVFINNRLTHL